MENVLVTGGAGFIGSHLCDELLRKGFKVICIDIFDDNYSPKIKKQNITNAQKHENFSFKNCDIRNPTELDKVFKSREIAYVFHLAAKTGVRYSVSNPINYFDTNVNGTINILQKCVEYKVKKLIFASSSSVYGSQSTIPFAESSNTFPDSPYGATKLAAEHMCRIYNKIHGLQSACLRFFTVYGPRGRPDMAPYIFTEKISKGQEITVFGDGSSRRDYTYVSDVISALLSCIDKDFEFEIVNIGNANPINLLTFVNTIEELIGKKANIKFADSQPGDMMETYADITRAKQLLDYNPKVNLKQGLHKFIDWWKAKCVE